MRNLGMEFCQTFLPIQIQNMIFNEKIVRQRREVKNFFVSRMFHLGGFFIKLDFLKDYLRNIVSQFLSNSFNAYWRL
jgi:hypothetical protein